MLKKGKNNDKSSIDKCSIRESRQDSIHEASVLTRHKLSEHRLYPIIKERLSDMGWDVRSPISGGLVYEQGEVASDTQLKQALDRDRPENVVKLGHNRYWAIEAKCEGRHLKNALKEAKEYANKINNTVGITCPIITGIAGNPDNYYVETECLVGKKWKTLSLNKRIATGFLSKEQIETVLESRSSNLSDYEIDDKLFSNKMGDINNILYNGAIEQKNRAQVLACILLALANDSKMKLSDTPTNLINDINSRAKAELDKHGKGNFYKEIRIHTPTSTDNHVKIKDALIKSIDILRDLNIASAIDSGRDVLGECFGQFLKYANDAKEMGIVLTPRIITNFGADVIDIKKTDKVFDPTCGTGGFLVAALDKVRKDTGNINKFKKGNLYGVEENALITTLAIVNMVFRGDGSSNIKEGDCFKQPYTDMMNKVLMNPPFARNEYEWEFVDYALKSMEEGGLLFAIVPTTVMASSSNERGAAAWRENMLKEHTLLSVIKMPPDLFYPEVAQGTYAIVIKAHVPHNMTKDKVVWAVLHDGVARTKTTVPRASNIDKIKASVTNFIVSQTLPKYTPAEIDSSLIEKSNLDLSPECYIGKKRNSRYFDISGVIGDVQQGNFAIHQHKTKNKWHHDSCQSFPLSHFFSQAERGKSGRNKELKQGDLPLISTSEKKNGISAMVCRKDVKKIYPSGSITISSNGGSCHAHYHGYEYAANGDVYTCLLKKEFAGDFSIFLCAAINSESWRFNYYRKFSQEQFDSIKIRIPVKGDKIDYKKIKDIVRNQYLSINGKNGR